VGFGGACGVPLAAVGIASDREVDGPENGLVRSPVEDLGGQEDQTGAGPEDGQAGGETLPQGFEEPGRPEQPADGGRLASGDDEGVGPSVAGSRTSKTSAPSAEKASAWGRKPPCRQARRASPGGPTIRGPPS